MSEGMKSDSTASCHDTIEVLKNVNSLYLYKIFVDLVKKSNITNEQKKSILTELDQTLTTCKLNKVDKSEWRNYIHSTFY